MVRWFRPRAVHQTTTRTWLDRYPEIFRACRDYLGHQQELRILSFGCSTGEEVVTLRNYFPTDWITGAEINPRSLAICRSLPVDDRTSFIYSTREAVRARGPYDAIFCMAVLQRTPHAIESAGLTSLKDIYPFERFEQQVSELDAILKPGGLLVIHHTQYRLGDSSLGARYSPLDVSGLPEDRGPVFDRESALLVEGKRAGSIFVKQA